MSAMATDEHVQLEDVANVVGFATWMADRTFGGNDQMTDGEREEARGEAVVLIYDLHGTWDQARCERFSAYLLTYLPRKLISWWRVNLRQSGRGRWSGSAGEYRYHGMVSLNAAELASEVRDSALIVHDHG